MKNRLLFAAIVCSLLSFGAFPQGFVGLKNDKNKSDFKKHNFGVGAQTEIFSQSRALNDFNPPKSYIDIPFDHIKVFDINVKNNTSFGIYLEYQLRMNKAFSLSARLGYNYRRVDFRFDAQSCDWNGDLLLATHPMDKRDAHTVFSDIDIPLFFSYTLPINEHIAWTSSAGVGVAINIAKGGDDYAEIFDPNSDRPELKQQLWLCEWEIKPYAMVQTGLDLTMGTHRLRTYVACKLPFAVSSNYWEYSGTFPSGAFPTHDIYHNSIEVGMSFFL